MVLALIIGVSDPDELNWSIAIVMTLANALLVSIALKRDMPFVREPGKPFYLDVTGWWPAVMLAICRLITPGFSPQTYLLQTDLPILWRRRR